MSWQDFDWLDFEIGQYKESLEHRVREAYRAADLDSYDLWLDPGMQNIAAISELLKPFDPQLMRSYAVSSRVNHVANDDEACSAPVEIAEDQNRLFC